MGTEVKVVKTCSFASTSEEVYTESQYQSSLSREASTTKTKSQTISGEADLSYNSPKGGAGGSAAASWSKTRSFTKSSKYESFQQQTQRERVVSFEARALCTEFDAYFKDYSAKTFDVPFEQALSTLPEFYDSELHRDIYLDFFNAFGTHYVNRVFLGAKVS